ncbi:MAG TPA: hypothetical protein VNI53_02615 [Gammaproteobacteria bacterium]|nr:hypothetical protein [Gammaproteobacteria bacterium]
MAVLLCSQTLAAAPSTTKLAPAVRAITQAVSAGHATDLMQASLTRQLFRENAPFEARWNASGQVQVSITYDRNSVTPDTEALANLGATNIRVTELMGVVQAWVPPSQLTAVAGLSWVRRIAIPQYALTNNMAPLPPQLRAGSVDSQGDQILGASAFRTATGDTGQGITVGVIGPGDMGLSQSQGTGDLPSSVWVDPNYPGTSDGEGTAMMEIVHDLAPGSALAFCGPQTSADFVNCLTDLQNQAAQVIVDDLAFPVTAYFTNDSDVTAVQQWQSQHPSVRLVTAAGNFATSFWSGTYVPTAINPITINGVTYSEANNFGTNANPNYYDQITVAPSAQVGYILEWNDPWVSTSDINGSTPDDPNDYDVVLYDSSYNIIACNQGMTSDQTGCSQPGAAASATPGPQPVVDNLWTNTTTSSVVLNLAIYYRAGTPGNQLKLFVASPNSCEVTISPVTPIGSIVDHAALPYPAEITVGAINASYALNKQYILEPYSSQGPVTLSLLSNNPIQKPDYVGVDGVNISGAGGFPPAECGSPQPPPIFYGTSAAAPHVAALIALLESAGYTSDQVYGELQSSAITLTNANYSNGTGIPNGMYGYGMPNIALVKAVNSNPPPSSGSNSSGGGGSLGLFSLIALFMSLLIKTRSS